MLVNVDIYVSICECGNWGVGETEDDADAAVENNCCDVIVARVNYDGRINVSDNEVETAHSTLSPVSVSNGKVATVEDIRMNQPTVLTLDEAEGL